MEQNKLQVKCACGSGFKATATGPIAGFIAGCPACGRAHEAGNVDGAALSVFADVHEQAFGEQVSDD